jgi:hypothetical protein
MKSTAASTVVNGFSGNSLSFPGAPAAGDKPLEKRQNILDVIENLDAGEAEHDIPVDLQQHVTLPIRGILFGRAMICAINLDNASFVRPQEINPDRIDERPEPDRAIPGTAGSPGPTGTGTAKSAGSVFSLVEAPGF